MTKKIIMLLLVVTLSFSLFNISTKAEDMVGVEIDMTTSYLPAYSIYWYVIYRANIPFRTEIIDISIVEAVLGLPEAGGLNSELVLSSTLDPNIEYTRNLLSVFNGNIYGNSSINLREIAGDDWANIDTVKIYVIHDEDPVPVSTYWEGLELGSYLTVYGSVNDFTAKPTVYIDINMDTYPLTYYQTTIRLNNMAHNSRSALVYIPPNDYMVYKLPSFTNEAVVKIYDKTPTLLETVKLSDIGDLSAGYFIIDFLTLHIDTTDLVNRIDLEIIIPNTFTIIPKQYLSFLQDNVSISFNADYFKLIMIDNYNDTETVIYVREGDTVDYGWLPDIGFLTFVGWVFEDGEPVYSRIKKSYIVNNEVRIYSSYRLIVTPDIPVEEVDPDLNTITILLNDIGFNSIAGKFMFYVIVLSLFIIPMIVYRLPLLVISMAGLSVTAFFNIFITLPVIAVYLMYGLWTMILLVSIKGGSQYE